MPKFWVDIKLEIRGRLEIQADSLEQAKQQAEELVAADANIEPDDLMWSEQDQEIVDVSEVTYRKREPRKTGVA